MTEESEIQIDSKRGIDPETKRELKANHDCRFEELFDTNVLDQFRNPDAEEARPYFDSAEQSSDFEVEVTLGDYTAIITGEMGYEWDVTVKTGGGLEAVMPGYEFSIEGGQVIDHDEGDFRVRYLGLWADHTLVFEKVRNVLQQVNDFDPPRHRKQAQRWRQTDKAPRRSLRTDETADAQEQEA